MFCQECGKQINDNEAFCVYCGKPTKFNQGQPPIQQSPVQQPPLQPNMSQQFPPQQNYSQQFPPQQNYSQQFPPQQNFSQQYAPQQNYSQQYIKPKKKSNALVGIIVGIVIIGLISAAGFYFLNTKSGKNLKSSIVSKGVNTDDLGNIMNGQYYFDDGTNQYYSSFDSNTSAHIYKATKGSSSATSIFDGFGWSLVVNSNWLYFSGNAGKTIDGTYNLFRVKTDGTGLETINTGYCYGMNIYKQKLYFIRRPSKDASESNIYRSDLDGSNETIIVTGQISYFVVYNTKIYYLDGAGDLYYATDDGVTKTKISTEAIYRFIIGNGKIICQTSAGDIKVMNTDGTNQILVRNAGSRPIAALNSYKGNIFYAEYDKDAVAGTYAYNYYLHSVKFDGTGDTQIYSGLSYGTYVNILNSKVFVLDYAKDPTTGNMPAIVRNMDLDGKKLQDLFR